MWKTTKRFAGKQTKRSAPAEEFFRLPRAESLRQKIRLGVAEDLEKMVLNERIERTDRSTIPVEDNRMADAGICRGDYVVVQPLRHYHDGDVLVVQLGERVFIRRFFRCGRRIRLECYTPDRQAMILDESTPGFSIVGRVVQVVRSF